MLFIFNATLAENNVFGALAGETKAVSDMYVLFLQPLSPGKHELRLSYNRYQSFAYDVIYHLMVGQNSTNSTGK